MSNEIRPETENLANAWAHRKQTLNDVIHTIRGGWYVNTEDLMGGHSWERSEETQREAREFFEAKLAEIEQAMITYRGVLVELDTLRQAGAEDAFYQVQIDRMEKRIQAGGN